MIVLLVISVMSVFMWFSWYMSNTLYHSDKKCCLQKNCKDTMFLNYYWWATFILAISSIVLIILYLLFNTNIGSSIRRLRR